LIKRKVFIKRRDNTVDFYNINCLVFFFLIFIDNNLGAVVFVCKNNDDPVNYQTLESN